MLNRFFAQTHSFKLTSRKSITFVAWYALVVGTLMVGQWVLFIISGKVPEFKTEPLRIAFHLAAEGITAILLIIAGIGLLRSLPWSRNLALVAFGALIYISMVSPGYFAQLGQWTMVLMFGIILLLALIAILILMKSK